MSTDMTVFDPSIAHEMMRELREENKRLARALQDANLRADRAGEDSTRALAALRKQLSPLYRALQAVFGELDAAGIGDTAPVGNGDPRVSAVWDSWKSRMGGSYAKVIDALLTHGELNTQQLSVVVGLHRTTIPALIHKLNKNGLINKNGGKFSLKPLS